MLLVILAFVLAVPIARYATDRWLGIFLAGGALLLAVAVATLSFHTIRAAHSNPGG
jgi:putative ABC transport system permease protein